MGESTHETVAQWLMESPRAVVFTGAGISTESGIPDFRSPGGVWATNRPVYFDEFIRSAGARHEYWRQKSLAHRDFARALPNVGHQTLAAWERIGRLSAVITQNIDGLHQLAGSQRVIELHGTARFVSCLSCHSRFEADCMVAHFVEHDQPPDCPDCGGLLKHATVSFGQAMPVDLLEEASDLAQQSSLFVAIGSSLVVHPAAGLPALAARRGARLVIINRDPTPQDHLAVAVIRDSIGETLVTIDRHVGKQSRD